MLKLTKHTNARMDGFKNLLIRYETKLTSVVLRSMIFLCTKFGMNYVLCTSVLKTIE